MKRSFGNVLKVFDALDLEIFEVYGNAFDVTTRSVATMVKIEINDDDDMFFDLAPFIMLLFLMIFFA